MSVLEVDREAVVEVITDAPALLLYDQDMIQQMIAERQSRGIDGPDEVWNGIYIIMPIANIDHQRLGARLWAIFEAIVPEGTGVACPPVNVSDRKKGWVENFRIPDASVFLKDGPGRNCGTHWWGGPDFAVEVLSNRDPAREKRGFYAANGVRELLLIDREPWAIELYRLSDGVLGLVGTSGGDEPAVLASEVLSLTFDLVRSEGEDRPRIGVTSTRDGYRWLV